MSNLKYNYHDSLLDSFELGPRKELKLKIQLTEKNDSVVNIRFGGIENLSEIETFFKNLPPKRSAEVFFEKIENFQKKGKTNYSIEFEYSGIIEIKCKNLTETGE